MAGFGRFKLTDALPEQAAEIEASQPQAGGPSGVHPPVRGKGKGKDEK